MNIRKILQFKTDKITTEDIGFEIEVEGANLPNRVAGWEVTTDGSLRGEESLEYVLREPSSYVKFCEALSKLHGAYESRGTRIDDSVRAGVHAHINVQELTVKQLFNFITICIIMETSLAELCGKSRVGNLFCLRSVDAEYLLKVIQDVAKTGNLSLFHTDDIRYSFMNMKALLEHGSVEFRAMRSTTDFELLKNWVKLLMKLRASAVTYDNPTEVIAAFEELGPTGFRELTLGNLSGLLAFPDSEEMLAYGHQTAQDIAYCTDWGKFDTMGSNNNPFATASDKPLFPQTMPEGPRMMGPDGTLQTRAGRKSKGRNTWATFGGGVTTQ